MADRKGEAEITAGVRWVLRDAAKTIEQTMRDEVALAEDSETAARADEVKRFAAGLVPRVLDGRPDWTDNQVRDALTASGRLRLAILQGMASNDSSVRAEIVGPTSQWEQSWINEQEWREGQVGLRLDQAYIVFKAYQLLMSAGAPDGDQRESGPPETKPNDWFAEILAGRQVHPNKLMKKISEIQDSDGIKTRLGVIRKIVNEYRAELQQCNPDSRNHVTWLEGIAKRERKRKREQNKSKTRAVSLFESKTGA